MFAITRESTKIGVKVVRATADIPPHFQGQSQKVALRSCSSHHLQGAGMLYYSPQCLFTLSLNNFCVHCNKMHEISASNISCGLSLVQLHKNVSLLCWLWVKHRNHTADCIGADAKYTCMSRYIHIIIFIILMLCHANDVDDRGLPKCSCVYVRSSIGDTHVFMLLIYLDLFVEISNMFCFAFSHLKRSPAIIYGNGFTTSRSPK